MLRIVFSDAARGYKWIAPDDIGTQIWRIEIRAGKVGLGNHIGKAQQRTYETVEAILPAFLAKAVKNIRYATNKGEMSNVSRSTVHPIWQAEQRAVQALPKHSKPALPRNIMLELMRKEKVTMASAQAFGNLNNLLVLEGNSPDKSARQFSGLAAKKALEYSQNIGGEAHFRKLKLAQIKNEVFLTPKAKKRGP